MAEEFENYEARMDEARRAVEAWEAEGGQSGDTAHQARKAGPTQQDTTPVCMSFRKAKDLAASRRRTGTDTNAYVAYDVAQMCWCVK